jgi:hypothetical protein
VKVDGSGEKFAVLTHQGNLTGVAYTELPNRS